MSSNTATASHPSPGSQYHSHKPYSVANRDSLSLLTAAAAATAVCYVGKLLRHMPSLTPCYTPYGLPSHGHLGRVAVVTVGWCDVKSPYYTSCIFALVFEPACELACQSMLHCTAMPERFDLTNHERGRKNGRRVTMEALGIGQRTVQ